MIRVALLTTDSREHFKDYANPNPYFGAAPEALIEGFMGNSQAIEVHIISCLQKKPISSPTKLADAVYYHALEVPKIGWMKTGFQGCIGAVRRKLDEIQPDIVHGQGTERDCAICAILSGFPNILTIHGLMRSIYAVTQSLPLSYYWFAKHLETIALRQTQGVIAISPYVAATVSHLNPQTWLIPNALRSPFLVPILSRSRGQNSPRLLNVGVVTPNKRQLELLKVFIRLREETQFTITFVGNADRESTYVRQFMDLLHTANSLHGGFHHLDHVSAEGLVEMYDGSDALVHFSREESFGLIFAEALARNLPLFASDVGAIRQISEGVPNCQIFNPNDFESLASAIGNWIRAGKYLKTRPPTTNSVVEFRYSPRAVAAMHIRAYEELLENIRRGHRSNIGVNRFI